jgi:TfoX/Sxy family transcriptional regulator of competence genes
MVAKKGTQTMPKWRVAPEALVRRFTEAIRAVPEAQVRKMFGYPAAFINGNMFTALFQEDIILRLSPADRTSLLEDGDAKPFEPMPGRPMREYVALPPAIVSSPADLHGWIEKARAHVRSLPAKRPAVKVKRSRSKS